MQEDVIKIRKKTLVWILIAFVFLVWLFWPKGEYTYFSFEIKDTGEKVDGSVFFDDILMGSTQKGKIKIAEQETIPRVIWFRGIYTGNPFELVYSFPEDYLSYSEIPFSMNKKDLEKVKIEDNYSNISELHWGHMPLTYKIEGECLERILNSTKLAFEKIKEETGLIWFEEVEENPDISVYCRILKDNNVPGDVIIVNVDSYEVGNSRKTIDSKRNLITYGELGIPGRGVCGTGYPAVEVHEILHLLNIPHNPLTNSIMHPYTADYSSKCKITKIDKEYVSCLKYIYSNGEFNGNCNFLNFINETNSEEYTCPDNFYPVGGTEYCCPEPNMEIFGDYCV